MKKVLVGKSKDQDQNKKEFIKEINELIDKLNSEVEQKNDQISLFENARDNINPLLKTDAVEWALQSEWYQMENCVASFEGGISALITLRDQVDLPF